MSDIGGSRLHPAPLPFIAIEGAPANGARKELSMVMIRKEIARDVAAREALLDHAFGDARFAKTAERLRECRMPFAGPRAVVCGS
jgi:hypothetical protein